MYDKQYILYKKKHLTPAGISLIPMGLAFDLPNYLNNVLMNRHSVFEEKKQLKYVSTSK